ncbi:hypothetical protein EYF80_031233 [Liparis tanakae]|uniref:Uncharacterized protein n=1 Tax=Liparis tanakae TaxID=230148 RepID=A0A4Z2H0L1_9TELE|nr:hypothetical protein EYF80_031233 [Liparis tanakae]
MTMRSFLASSVTKATSLEEVDGGDEALAGFVQAVSGQLSYLVVNEAEDAVGQRKNVFRRFFNLMGGDGGGADLRLRERGRMWGEQWPPSSSVMLSALPKCLDKKWSSSMVGWKGSWCSRS